MKHPENLKTTRGPFLHWSEKVSSPNSPDPILHRMWHEIPNIFGQKASAVNPQIIQLDLYTMTLCQHMCLVLAVTRFLGWVILTLQLPYISRNTCETATSEARSTAKEQVLVSLKLATCDAIEHHRNFFQVPIAIFQTKQFPPKQSTSPKPCSHHHRDSHRH